MTAPAPLWTPGPWRVDNDMRGRARGVSAGLRDHSRPDVCVVTWRGIAKAASDEGQANARLIASAPALVEALEDLLEEWDGLGYGDDDGEPVPDQSRVALKARAALSLARGGGE